MNTESASPEPLSREKKLFRLTIFVFLGLLVGAFIPIAGLVIFIPFFCTGLLWSYVGLLAVCIVFPISLLVARRRGQNLRSSIVSAVRWSVVVFGAVGLVLGLSVLVVPGYKQFTLGYWIHSKIWLNPAQVRTWATSEKGTADRAETVPYKFWPSSLRLASLGSGRVYVDPLTKAVTLVDGGGFGHWGIKVAAPGDACTGPNYFIKLEDGAWVWHEIQ
jgi:hypothetical protein